MKLQIFFMKLQIFFMNFKYFLSPQDLLQDMGDRECSVAADHGQGQAGDWWLAKLPQFATFDCRRIITPRAGHPAIIHNTPTRGIGQLEALINIINNSVLLGYLVIYKVIMSFLNPLPLSKRLKYLFNKTVGWIPPLCVLHKQRVRIIRFLVHVLFRNLLTSIASPGTTARSARHKLSL